MGPRRAEGNPWRYTGGYWDAGVGLYKLGARYYDPARGRFTQPDPLGGGYVYANDDPVNYVDPSGLESDPVIGFANISVDPYEPTFKKYGYIEVTIIGEVEYSDVLVQAYATVYKITGYASGVPIPDLAGAQIIQFDPISLYTRPDNQEFFFQGGVFVPSGDYLVVVQVVAEYNGTPYQGGGPIGPVTVP